jgi:hypothetical protein
MKGRGVQWSFRAQAPHDRVEQGQTAFFKLESSQSRFPEEDAKGMVDLCKMLVATASPASAAAHPSSPHGSHPIAMPNIQPK